MGQIGILENKQWESKIVLGVRGMATVCVVICLVLQRSMTSLIFLKKLFYDVSVLLYWVLME